MLIAAELLAVVVIVAANAFFVAAEYALVTVRRTRLQELEAQGVRRARRVLNLLDNPSGFISAIQLGVTLSSLALGAIGEPVVSELLQKPLDWLPRRPAHGRCHHDLDHPCVHDPDLLPRGHGRDRAQVVHASAQRAGRARGRPPDHVFRTLFRPFIWVLVGSSSAVLRWFGLPPPSGISLVHSEEELKMLVTASRQKGVLEEEEQEMLHKVFEFADKDAEDVMVPRPDVVALPLDTPIADLLTTVLRNPYTRYPVFGEDIDDIAGVLHVRDLFSAINERGLERTDVQSILRPAILVPETKPLDELLAEFRRTSNHMAIVVDEYGSVAAWPRSRICWRRSWARSATSSICPTSGILRIGRGRVRIGGSFPIEQFNDRFGTDLSDEDYHTVGGFVFGELGRAPLVGDVGQFRRGSIRGGGRRRPAHHRGRRRPDSSRPTAGARRGSELGRSVELVAAIGHGDVVGRDPAFGVADPRAPRPHPR